MRKIIKVQHENLQLPLSPKCGKKGKIDKKNSC